MCWTLLIKESALGQIRIILIFRCAQIQKAAQPALCTGRSYFAPVKGMLSRTFRALDNVLRITIRLWFGAPRLTTRECSRQSRWQASLPSVLLLIRSALGRTASGFAPLGRLARKIAYAISAPSRRRLIRRTLCPILFHRKRNAYDFSLRCLVKKSMTRPGCSAGYL